MGSKGAGGGACGDAVAAAAFADLILLPQMAPSGGGPHVGISAGRIALTHARVIDGTGAPSREDMTVALDGARIVPSGAHLAMSACLCLPYRDRRELASSSPPPPCAASSCRRARWVCMVWSASMSR